MRQVVLYFPDTKALSDFLMDTQPLHPEANSEERSLTCDLPDEEIVKAELRYKALWMLPQRKSPNWQD
jgi:hypothetical protein